MTSTCSARSDGLQLPVLTLSDMAAIRKVLRQADARGSGRRGRRSGTRWSGQKDIQVVEERSSYRSGSSGSGTQTGHRVVEDVGRRECHDLAGARRRGGGRRRCVWNGISLALVQLAFAMCFGT